ncbi:lanthionine synthetase C family protein [Acrocarpospora sp. B8E8]|uniref:lanthionine synthetase C family protein n=1 Tax=Acrocarpospora sp. B8E8 TaxID=3153572 RepID=UPI00325C92F6
MLVARPGQLATATRLTDTVAEPPPPPADDDRSATSPRWLGQSLSKGAAGIAVLHAARARAGLADWTPAHNWLAAATRDDLTAAGGAGLWFGAPAVAFALTFAPAELYPSTRAALDAAVTALTRTRLAAATVRMDARTRPTSAEYDLVRGLTGLGAYALNHGRHDLVRDVLTYLVRLTEPVNVADAAGLDVPGWWTNDPHAASNQGGYASLGMAHGIGGPLALLALALRQGIMVDGHAAAIQRICQWLGSWRQDGSHGPWWPERVCLSEHRTRRPAQSGPARPSWCYGTPGLARAQQLAALATGDGARQDLAEDALARCVSDPVQLGRLAGLGLCHGWSGTLATAWCAAADADSSRLADLLPQLTDAVIRIAASTRPAPPGLIDGRAGVALILHSLTHADSTRWMRCLLIS